MKITDQALIGALRREAASGHPAAAPVSIDAAVLRAILAASPAAVPFPRNNFQRFVPALGAGLAACLVLGAVLGALRVKSACEDNLREAQALVANVTSVASFLAHVAKPVTNGIRG